SPTQITRGSFGGPSLPVNLRDPARLVGMDAQPEKAVTAMAGIDESDLLPFTTAPAVEGRSRDEVVEELFHAEYAGGEEFTLTRLSPASDAGAALAWSGQDVEIRTVEWAGSLRGVYLRQGTGVTLLVEFDTSAGRATYRLDDDGGLFHDPDDEGS